jgi:endonuclease YncB( thermonuclease family)
MIRRHLLAALALLLCSSAPFTSTAVAADVAATVRDVIDGDTVVLDDGRKVRYLGINAPEHGQPYARDATNVNRRLVSGLPVRLEFDQIREDRHGRLLAYVHRDGALVNEQLLAEGLAHVFSIPPNTRYAERFLHVQRKAKAARKGMWKTARGPLKITRIEPKGNGDEGTGALAEFVRIANVSDQTVDVAGYSITDRDGHRYDFPSAQLRPGQVLTLVTGEGQDRRDGTGPIALHWKRRSPVWNDRGDTAILADPSGERVDKFDYKAGRSRGRLHRGD